jgi:hypothetical protein
MTAERIWVVYRAIYLVLWCALVVTVVLAYQGADSSSTWLARAVMLGVASLVTVGFIPLARHQLRRAVARPIPQRGVNGWLARQPGWRLALLYWALYLVVMGSVWIGVSTQMHRSPPWESIAVVLVLLPFGAVGQAAQNRVRFQRQADAGQARERAGITSVVLRIRNRCDIVSQ